jgi:3-methyladenine DNA glycosylase AlkD
LTTRNENAQVPSKLEKEILKRLATLPARDTESIRRVRRDFTKQLAREPADVVLALALRLGGSRDTAHRFVASELLKFHTAAFRSLNPGLIRQLSRGMDNWAAVDIFACYLSGPAWREGLVSGDLIKQWAHSKNVWLRRAALVSTVPLNIKARGGTGDTKRTLEVCEMLVTDRDDMVVKAMSWALRELSKRDARAVKQFIVEYQNVLAPRVLREVNNKLRTGLKNPAKKH